MTFCRSLEYPDPRLRQRANPVAVFDAGLARLIDDLIETLGATKGIALSAPQTGDRRRVVVIDQTDGAGTAEHYVNPEILARAAPGFVQESCLSVPGIVGSVWRSTKVKVRARDRLGQPFERELKGMHAVCMQHEIDHLEGKLFIDRLWFFRRLLVRSRLDARALHSKTSSEGAPGIA